jgi:hypothetical protein
VTDSKAKGQQPLVSKPELLALYAFRGGLAERSNAAALQAVNGASPTVQGSESLTRRNNNYTPAKALTSAGAKIRTAEAERTFQSHYRPSSVRSQGDFADDVPQLPN